MSCKCNDLLEEYQEWTPTTAKYDKEVEEVYLLTGLAAEAGEMVGKFAKLIRDGQGEVLWGTPYEMSVYQNDVLKELGDIQWFISQICNMYGFTMKDVLLMNMAKLESRKERGVLGGSGDNR